MFCWRYVLSSIWYVVWWNMFLKTVVKWVFEWREVTKSAIYLKDIGPSGGIWRHRADWSVFNPLAQCTRKHIFQTSSQRQHQPQLQEYGMGYTGALSWSYCFSKVTNLVEWANKSCSPSTIQLNLNLSFHWQFHKIAFSTCSALRWVTHDVFTDQSDYPPNTFDFPE